ncbi:hypothetical protein ACROYT_G019098 [Oculina patagonica]
MLILTEYSNSQERTEPRPGRSVNLQKKKMSKLLLLSILACLVLLASSKPTPDETLDDAVVSNERRSPCGAGGCQFLTGVKFGGRKSGARRRPGKYYNNRFRNSRDWFDLPDDDYYDNE